MAQTLTLQTLEAENQSFAGTGGISSANQHCGFIPGFLDRETGAVYCSCWADGTPAPSTPWTACPIIWYWVATPRPYHRCQIQHRRRLHPFRAFLYPRTGCSLPRVATRPAGSAACPGSIGRPAADCTRTPDTRRHAAAGIPRPRLFPGDIDDALQLAIARLSFL